MTQVLKSSVLLAVALLVSAPAFAHTGSHQHEIEATATSILGRGLSSGASLTFGEDFDDMVIAVGAGYHYSLMDMIQVGTRSRVSIVGDAFDFQVLVGPTLNYNLGGGAADASNAIYLGAYGGLNHIDGGTTSTNDASFQFEIGKRFELAPGISWKPNFNVAFTTRDGDNLDFAIVPVAFSFFL